MTDGGGIEVDDERRPEGARQMTDARDIARRLAEWASAEHGGEVRVHGTPSTASAGMDNDVHFVQLAGDVLPREWTEPLVVRVQPDPDRFALASAEAAVQAWSNTQGYPAPAVLAMLEPGVVATPSAQVMERVSGRPMLEDMVPTVWHVPSLVRRLAALHVQLHRLPIEEWPLPDDAPRLAARRIAPVGRWCDELDNAAYRRAHDRVRTLVPRLDDCEAVACHGDFHPLNLLTDGSQAWVIDWTDAALGDRHGDVARTQLLFRVAAIAATAPAERTALRMASPLLANGYLRAYDHAWPIDRERLALWETVHLLHGWGQVLSLHAGAIGRDRERDQVPASLATWLQRRLERRLADLDF